MARTKEADGTKEGTNESTEDQTTSGEQLAPEIKEQLAGQVYCAVGGTAKGCHERASLVVMMKEADEVLDRRVVKGLEYTYGVCEGHRDKLDFHGTVLKVVPRGQDY